MAFLGCSHPQIPRLDTARANLAAAEAAITGARAEVEVLQAQRAETESSRADLQLAVAQAQRDLDMTVLRAPFDGTVANVAIEQGELVSPGVRLAAVVPDHGLYVEANFKETQLKHMRLGQTVELHSDLYGGGVDYTGRIESLGLGASTAC